MVELKNRLLKVTVLLVEFLVLTGYLIKTIHDTLQSNWRVMDGHQLHLLLRIPKDFTDFRWISWVYPFKLVTGRKGDSHITGVPHQPNRFHRHFEDLWKQNKDLESTHDHVAVRAHHIQEDIQRETPGKSLSTNYIVDKLELVIVSILGKGILEKLAVVLDRHLRCDSH